MHIKFLFCSLCEGRSPLGAIAFTAFSTSKLIRVSRDEWGEVFIGDAGVPVGTVGVGIAVGIAFLVAVITMLLFQQSTSCSKNFKTISQIFLFRCKLIDLHATCIPLNFQVFLLKGLGCQSKGNFVLLCLLLLSWSRRDRNRWKGRGRNRWRGRRD